MRRSGCWCLSGLCDKGVIAIDTDTVRAWAAGFIDAKAYVPVKPDAPPRIIIKKKDRIVLDYLERHFGGNVRSQRDGTHVWSICGDAARRFARDISAYVVVKVDRIEEIAKQPLTGRRHKKRDESRPESA